MPAEPASPARAAPRLYVVAFPELAAADAAFVDTFRSRHDRPRRELVDAHFTLVFGCEGIDPAAVDAHAGAVARATAPVRFECRRAEPGAGTDGRTTHVFLVPDAGRDAIERLHAALHRGALQPQRRADIAFVPHITIGTLDDAERARALCDDLAAAGLRIDGWLRALTVGIVEAGRFVALSTHALAGPAEGASPEPVVPR